ncbi:MAG TPA: tRNA uridine-5-carboxymethylaminomethyl(34) synthesis GTPase MnmE, partial [Pyrinomonadaceae bacterium]|nr:tRNA uridine-5-carboxymethylaminomethyl(34) synthesis GTPase MnmE [Pyrinomonadaceae bacterium]
MTDTIVALATPTGRSGIGIIRLSGPESLAITSRIARDAAFAPQPRTTYLKQISDPEIGELIDEAIITYFQAPHSFTGEDVVEISCHGSPLVLRQVIDACLHLGARLAEAGEFSLRALANGRMDLTEAEAIRDIIDSQTVASARQAVRQLRGEFSHELQPIKDDLLNIIVLFESALEFVEDDLPEVQLKSTSDKLVSIRNSIQKIASTYNAGHLIREGLKVAIVGRPNVGKSSLFNALLGSERAIVTEIAGTTRDQLHEKLTIGDIPISLIDTAGLRDTIDTVESIGVERSRRTMADADIVMTMIDVSERITNEDLDILRSVSELNHLVVFNKIDKVTENELNTKIAAFRSKYQWGGSAVAVSAKTGAGLNNLKDAVVQPFRTDNIIMAGFLVTDARHHDLLVRTTSEIDQSLNSLTEKASEEIVLIGLHNALRYLGQITGETTTEDMLTRIFSTFCIGK